jgi:predicted NAD/FAD-binding protein
MPGAGSIPAIAHQRRGMKLTGKRVFFVNRDGGQYQEDQVIMVVAADIAEAARLLQEAEPDEATLANSIYDYRPTPVLIVIPDEVQESV